MEEAGLEMVRETRAFVLDVVDECEVPKGLRKDSGYGVMLSEKTHGSVPLTSTVKSRGDGSEAIGA